LYDLLFVEQLVNLLGFDEAEGTYDYSPRVCYSPVHTLLAMPTKVVFIAKWVMTF